MPKFLAHMTIAASWLPRADRKKMRDPNTKVGASSLLARAEPYEHLEVLDRNIMFSGP